jgi:predicted permease
MDASLLRLREWFLRFFATLRPSRTDRDLQRELSAHIELASDAAVAHGASAHEARRTAALQLGGIAQAMEHLRDQRELAWLRDFARDVRYGARLFARDRLFTIVAIVSLAIGVGANCAVFSAADTLLFRPLTIPQPGELMVIGTSDPFSGVLTASYADYVDIRARSSQFAGLIASTGITASFSPERGSPTPRLTMGMLVSDNFFEVVGIQPVIGRSFLPDEMRVLNRDAVVILSYDAWTRQFAGDRSVLGQTVLLNGTPFTIVGIAPRGFEGLSQFTRYEFYVPLAMWPRLLGAAEADPLGRRDFRKLTISGRLLASASVTQARAELATVAADLARAYPTTNRDQTLTIRSEIQNRMAGNPPVAMLLGMLTALSGAVLFIACANVAGLLTGRAPTRAREIATRLTLGATRSRIIRQLLTESLLLAVLGGAAGLAVGHLGIILLRQLQIPTDLPVQLSFELNQRAVFVSMAIALISALIYALAPALKSSRIGISVGARVTHGGRQKNSYWSRSWLVGAQVAASVLVLLVATLVYRQFRDVTLNGPGFRTDHLLMQSMAPRQLRYSDEASQHFFERVSDEARRIPGVTQATVTRYMPMDGGPPALAIVPEGAQLAPHSDAVTLPFSSVDEHYFDVLRLPILEGRAFLDTDTAASPRVAIVNEVVAQRYWPGRSALGQRFVASEAPGSPIEIVGVAKTAKYTSLLERGRPFVYLPFRQQSPESMFLLVEFNRSPSEVALALRDVVRGLDSRMPITAVRTMDEHYRIRATGVLNVVNGIIGAMGLMGLTLAAIGLYGVVAHAASRRHKEIGIRMAIGARQSQVMRMVLRQGVQIAIAGLAVGISVGVFATRAIGSVVFLGAIDGAAVAISLMVVTVAVFALGIVATWIPAYRASCTNPVTALRCD